MENAGSHYNTTILSLLELLRSPFQTNKTVLVDSSALQFEQWDFLELWWKIINNCYGDNVFVWSQDSRRTELKPTIMRKEPHYTDFPYLIQFLLNTNLKLSFCSSHAYSFIFTNALLLWGYPRKIWGHKLCALIFYLCLIILKPELILMEEWMYWSNWSIVLALHSPFK